MDSNEISNINALKGLTNLMELSIGGNPKITKSQIIQLTKCLPNCDIGSDYYIGS